ncbi:hypothetical protein GCM10023175_47210 [Pseudonocardia xishanensis]|uniref:PrsW family intramembrane metalloprotease n=1 Tax=Pseudonocardia xishanensis TaxID=630995 RepID=A0ABP8RXW3_9PSEU
MKLLVPVGVLVFTRYRANPVDGLLVGVAVGTGFAVLETLGYGFVALLASGGDLRTAEAVLLLRGVSSPAAHLAWSGVLAAALWHAHARRWRPRAVARLVAAYVLVVGLHALTDAVSGWVALVAAAAASMALLLWVTHRELVLGRRAVDGGPPARPGSGRPVPITRPSAPAPPVSPTVRLESDGRPSGAVPTDRSEA